MAQIISSRPSAHWKDRATGFSVHIVLFTCGCRGTLRGTADAARDYTGKCSKCESKEDESTLIGRVAWLMHNGQLVEGEIVALNTELNTCTFDLLDAEHTLDRVPVVDVLLTHKQALAAIAEQIRKLGHQAQQLDRQTVKGGN